MSWLPIEGKPQPPPCQDHPPPSPLPSREMLRIMSEEALSPYLPSQMQAMLLISEIPALRRMRQEGLDFKASLSYTLRFCL